MVELETVIKELELIRDYDPMIRVAHDDVFKRYAIDALALLKAQQPHVMTLEEVITSKFGQTIWLESYFDGITSLEAFLVDIECSNKPVLVNGRYEFYNLDAIEIDEAILSTFHEKYKVKKYRFWSDKPTEEQRKAVKWDE